MEPVPDGPQGWQEQLERAAARRLPAAVLDYVRAGAREGVTAAEATSAWRAVRLLPRVLRDVAEVDIATTLLGRRYELPFGVAPTSLQRCADDAGELAMARATAAAGAPHVVSGNAGHPFASIGAESADWWLQAYLTAGRDDCARMLDAGVAAGASAVVLTADTPVVGTKYRPAEADFAGVDLSWHRCNYPVGMNARQQGRWASDVTLADIERLRARTGLPVVVKGVLRADDATACVQAGAAAVWVSNHGGRQLDRSVSTAAALPRVVAAVGPDVEVYVDGGIRSGLDLVTALGLGARAVLLGRLPFYALAANGEGGVATMLERLRVELVEALRLAGCADLAATAGLVDPPGPEFAL